MLAVGIYYGADYFLDFESRWEAFKTDKIHHEEVTEKTSKEKTTTETSDNIEKVTVSGKSYYLEQLSDENQDVYQEVYKGLLKLKKSIRAGVRDEEELGKIYYAVLYDHPEIFWCNSSYQIKYNSRGFLYYELMPSYRYTQNEVNEIQTKIDKTTEGLLSKISSSDSDYEKIRKVYETLVNGLDYDTDGDASQDQNIDSAFINRSTVCAGYSKATKYLLDQLDIFCIYVPGVATSRDGSGEHSWNIVQCDRNYYHVDTTWGDPTYTGEQSGSSREDNINYFYLNCNDEAIFRTHKLDDTYSFEYPKCSSMEQNYFSVNGRYFENYSREQFQEIIKKDIKNSLKSTSVCYATKEAYQSAVANLQSDLDYGMKLYGKTHGLSTVKCKYLQNDDEYVITAIWE
jgi:transglutaminase/protease-like cytokinesis protein 3